MKYNQIVIGIDQSYKNTGITIVTDCKIRDIKSVRLENYPNNTERRLKLKSYLNKLLYSISSKSNDIICMVERTRVHGGGKSFINVDTIKAMGSLTALTVDMVYPYSIPVYSVDTRAWRAKVVGTSKPENNEYGVPPEKWPTVKWVISQGFEDKILIDVTNTRKTKGTFIRNGKRYMYNDDAADSAGIGMFWFVGNKNMLKKES